MRNLSGHSSRSRAMAARRANDLDFLKTRPRPTPGIMRLKARWETPKNAEQILSLLQGCADSTTVQPSILALEAQETEKRARRNSCIANDAAKDFREGVPLAETRKREVSSVGKRASKEKSDETSRRETAAIRIQALWRGDRERLMYQLSCLEKQLASQERRTEAVLAEIRQETRMNKCTLLREARAQAECKIERMMKDQQKFLDQQQSIAYFREDNRRLRQENDEMDQVIFALQQQNAQLEVANAEINAGMHTLKGFYAEVKATRKRLRQATSQYMRQADVMKESLIERRQYCESERKIKACYENLLGSIVQKLVEARDTSLSREVIKLTQGLSRSLSRERLVNSRTTTQS